MQGHVGVMAPIIIESCHSTWIFDAERGLFRRVLKDIDATPHEVVTPWRTYYGLEVDPHSESFVVLLNPEGTKLLSSWRHLTDCTECGGHATAELSLGDIRAQTRKARDEDAAGGGRAPTTGGVVDFIEREAPFEYERLRSVARLAGPQPGWPSGAPDMKAPWYAGWVSQVLATAGGRKNTPTTGV